MTYEIELCGREFELIQSEIPREAYEYWSQEGDEALHEYVMGGGRDEGQRIPAAADVIGLLLGDARGDIMEAPPAVSSLLDDAMPRSGMYVAADGELTVMSIRVGGKEILSQTILNDADITIEETEEWYDELLPEGCYLEAVYLNKSCFTYSLEISDSEPFKPENLVFFTVDWNGASLVHRVEYNGETGVIPAELTGEDRSGKSAEVRVFEHTESE